MIRSIDVIPFISDYVAEHSCIDYFSIDRNPVEGYGLIITFGHSDMHYSYYISFFELNELKHWEVYIRFVCEDLFSKLGGEKE